MDFKGGRSSGSNSSSSSLQSEEDLDLRRGPWTVEEDLTLINYIAHQGEGRWNSLARCAGLKRTGKSCRLRWLNYLRPDVRRGNITLEEQLLILELHSRWGNRWSKIAQHLPGRTDNEIKNYWRTRVQKHAKQLKCDVNSKQFKDTMRYLWMPRLVERIQAAAAATTTAGASSLSSTAVNTAAMVQNYPNNNNNMDSSNNNFQSGQMVLPQNVIGNEFSYTPENSSSAASPVSEFTEYYSTIPVINNNNPNPNYFQASQISGYPEMTSPAAAAGGYNLGQGLNFQTATAAMEQNNQWLDGGDTSDNFWNVEDIWFWQQQLEQQQ
ncbi:hypothetical protein UlMin_009173 [Ulmus minor]